MTYRKENGDGKAKFEALLKNAKMVNAQVGWVERKQYPDSSMTTAGAAAINEFGVPSKNIPPRPFMRPTIQKKKEEWSKIVEAESKKVLNGAQSIEGVMEVIGLKAAGDVREAITQLQSPALKPATIRARLARRANKHHVGNLTKPLVDTGYMLNSLTNKVTQGNDE